MTIKEIVESEALKAAVEDYRSMCFWNVDENSCRETGGRCCSRSTILRNTAT